MSPVKLNRRVFYALIIIWFAIGASLLFAAKNSATERHLNSTDAFAQSELQNKLLRNSSDDDAYLTKLRVLNEILIQLKNNYVDDVKMEELVDAAIEGVLSEVDPHTTYFDDDQLNQFLSETQGEFGGLGISIDKRGDYITVISPIEGTPAYKMGILAGDRLIKVDGVSVVGLSTEDSIKKMRGPSGSKVVVTIERPGVGELDFEIERDIITIKSIPYVFKLDNEVGYIRIRQFNAHTSTEFRRALDSLEKQAIKGLIVDLRFNPGGLLNEAIDTVNEFVGKDKRVVFTKGRTREANQEYYTKYDRIREGYPVVVLVNEASASAAEIFAGSMQDWDKGLVIGKTSFGKGSVQNIKPLYSGGLKITTSKYYIHSGRCIHKELNDKILRGKDVSDEEKERIDSESKETEYFTENGRKVFGGGGVTPDITIDQGILSELEMKIRQKNLFFDYSVDYFRNHESDIDEDFKLDDEIIDNFKKYIKEHEITYTDSQIDSISSWMNINLQANIIGKKYGEVASYKKLLATDLQFLAAKELFDKYNNLDQMFEHAESLRETKNLDNQLGQKE
jgi:carboxyl-terminal processing protease